MTPEATAHAATGVVDTLLNAGVLGAGILVLLALLAKVYMDARADKREYAAALEKKDERWMLTAAQTAADNAKQTALSERIVRHLERET